MPSIIISSTKESKGKSALGRRSHLPAQVRRHLGGVHLPILAISSLTMTALTLSPQTTSTRQPLQFPSLKVRRATLRLMLSWLRDWMPT